MHCNNTVLYGVASNSMSFVLDVNSVEVINHEVAKRKIQRAEDRRVLGEVQIVGGLLGFVCRVELWTTIFAHRAVSFLVRC